MRSDDAVASYTTLTDATESLRACRMMSGGATGSAADCYSASVRVRIPPRQQTSRAGVTGSTARSGRAGRGSNPWPGASIDAGGWAWRPARLISARCGFDSRARYQRFRGVSGSTPARHAGGAGSDPRRNRNATPDSSEEERPVEARETEVRFLLWRLLPRWRNVGRRAGLRHRCRKTWGFESLSGYCTHRPSPIGRGTRLRGARISVRIRGAVLWPWRNQ